MARLVPILALLFTSCATPGPAPAVPSARTVPGSEVEARARVEAAMRGLGLEPATEPSGLRAQSRGARPEWAECGVILINDRDSEARRSSWARPGARGATLTASFAPEAAGTRVTVAARFAATYVDPYANLPVEASCASTGALERALLDAAAGA